MGIRTFIEFLLLTGVMFIITFLSSSSALLIVKRFNLESYPAIAVWTVMGVFIPIYMLDIFLTKRRAEAEQRQFFKQAEEFFNKENSRRHENGYYGQDDSNDIDRYYRILGIRQGVSFIKVKEARADLIRVWHPDRFANTRFFYKAQEKLKEINNAYDNVTDNLRK